MGCNWHYKVTSQRKFKSKGLEKGLLTHKPLSISNDSHLTVCPSGLKEYYLSREWTKPKDTLLAPRKAVCPEASQRVVSAKMAHFMHNGGTFRSKNGTNAHILCPVPLTDMLNWARLPFSMELGVVSESGYTQNFKQCLQLITVSMKN